MLCIGSMEPLAKAGRTEPDDAIAWNPAI